MTKCILKKTNYVLKKVVYNGRDVTSRFATFDLQAQKYHVKDFLDDVFVKDAMIEFQWWVNNISSDPAIAKLWYTHENDYLLSNYGSPLEFFGEWTKVNAS